MTETVRVQEDRGILEITLNRPKVNAIDAATSQALGEAFVRLRDDRKLRVAIITGAGNSFFSAGWDLKAASRNEKEDQDYGSGGFEGLTELLDLNKPVIAAVNGKAIGGGFELILACDLIIAAEHSEFWLPEIGLVIIPDSGGVQRLPRQLPYHIAMEVLLTGRRIGCAEAKRYGLVNDVVPSIKVMSTARSLAQQIAEAAPLAVQAAKEVVRATECLSIQEAFEVIKTDKLMTYRRMLTSEDRKEGMRAFVEKRKAHFKYR